MTECTTHREALGALLLGGLDDREADEVQEHLAGCDQCREEWVSLTGVPALLDLAVDAPPPVPERVRDRVVADAVRRTRSRRWAAAVAAVAVIALGLGGIVGWQVAPRTTEVAVPLAEVAPYQAGGWMRLEAGPDDVAVRLELTGLDSLEEPGIYEAWLSTEDDELVSLGQFAPEADGSATVDLVAEGDVDDYRSFWLTAEPDADGPPHEGPTVVRAPVTAPR